MATLTVKNVPDELYDKLKRTAARHRRSMNSEAIVCLERSLGARRIDPDEFLAEVRALREQTPDIYVTDEDLKTAKSWGRP